MIEALEQTIVENEKLSISTRANLELTELGNFFLGLDNLYSLVFLFECLEVDSSYLKVLKSIEKHIKKVKQRFLNSEFKDYDEIINEITDFVEEKHEYNIGYTDKRKLKEVYESQALNPLNISQSVGTFLIYPFKKYFLSKGLGFKSDVWENMNEFQISEVRNTFYRNKYFDINEEKIKSITRILKGELVLKRINYNSPGSIDLLGFGKVLEVIKDFILELKKGNDNKSKANLEEALLVEKINEQQIANTSKSLDNIEKLIRLKEKSIHLDDKNLSSLIEFVEVNGVSLKEMSKKITAIELKAENE